MPKATKPRPLSHSEYLALAEFRYQLRRYLRHMEENATAKGHHHQQYQLLLAIKGLPAPLLPTVSTLAERMQMLHNGLVALADRAEQRGLIRRIRASASDRRKVVLAITPAGEKVLTEQASASRHELLSIGPVLVDTLQRLLRKHHKRQQLKMVRI